MGRKAVARGTRRLAAAAAAALVAGASEAVTYTEADVAPESGFGGTFEDRTVLPLDADAVVGVSEAACPTPFFCIDDPDYFAFGNLAPGTGFSITLEMLGDGYPPFPLAFIADYVAFGVYDDARNLLFPGTHSPSEDPLSFDGVVPVSGHIVVLAVARPVSIDDVIPLTGRYRVALDAQVIPEPATALLVGGGLAALGAGRLRARRKAKPPAGAPRAATPARARGPAPPGRGPRTG